MGNVFTVPLPSLSLPFISSTISSISFLPLSGRRHQNDPQGLKSLNPNTINQSISRFAIFNALGPVVQSVVKLNELDKGHFVNCFSGFNIQYSDIFCCIFAYHSM